MYLHRCTELYYLTIILQSKRCWADPAGLAFEWSRKEALVTKTARLAGVSMGPVTEVTSAFSLMGKGISIKIGSKTTTDSTYLMCVKTNKGVILPRVAECHWSHCISMTIHHRLHREGGCSDVYENECTAELSMKNPLKHSSPEMPQHSFQSYSQVGVCMFGTTEPCKEGI